MFDELEARDPDHFAVKQYRKYKLAASKTAKSILISCGARLAPFDIAELRELMSYDEMELDTLGDRKTALFVIISDTDETFNFVVAIMYSQMFNLLCDKADDVYNGRLPVHVRCLLDEFANIGQIPKFDKLIATIRSREISASIILQSQSQLKTIYKDAADTIVGNCEAGAVNTECPVCKNNMSECTGKAPEPEQPVEEPDLEPEVSENQSNIGLIIGVIAIVGIGGGAYYYFKFVRGKKKKDEDLDFFDDDGYEEEPYINEDEEPDIAEDDETQDEE